MAGQGRAVAHGRLLPGRFDDPTAMRLLRAEEREVVERLRAADPPRGLGARVGYELVRATAEILVPRTLTLDERIRGGPGGRVVVLGAVLDGRAWRVGLPVAGQLAAGILGRQAAHGPRRPAARRALALAVGGAPDGGAARPARFHGSA